MRRPSGLTATEFITSRCPSRVWIRVTGFEVPDRHGVVVGPGDDASPVGAHRHGTHRIMVPVEAVDSAAGLEVPDRHGGIVGA